MPNFNVNTNVGRVLLQANTNNVTITNDKITPDSVIIATPCSYQQGEQIYTNIRRCVLTDEGEVAYYLDPANSSFKMDGTLSDLSGADGQVMVEIPQVYVKYTNIANTHTWSISDIPLPDYTLHPAHVVDNEIVQYRYIGAYDACVYNPNSSAYESGLNYDYNLPSNGRQWDINSCKLSSVSGIYPAVGVHRSGFRKMAENRGTRWRILDFHLLSLIQLLYLMEYKSFDSQTNIGKGNVGLFYVGNSGNQSDSPHSIAGKSNHIGNSSGGVYSTTKDIAWVSYRGIENLWGNCSTIIDAINCYNHNVYVNTQNLRSTYADNTSTGYTLIGICPYSGWPKNILNYAFGFIPNIIGGTFNAYLHDYFSSSLGWSILWFGGSANAGTDGGNFRLDFNASSTSTSQSMGTRLAY